ASGLSITGSPTHSNGGGTGVTPFNRGYNAAFIWEAEQTARSGPFYAAANGGTGFVVQDLGTGANDGGCLTFPFNVPVAGAYRVSAVVNTPDQDHNSVYVGFEFNQPLTEPLNIWDLPVTGGTWQKGYASWRGNGINTAPQFPLMSWQLTAGAHTLYLIGRE